MATVTDLSFAQMNTAAQADPLIARDVFGWDADNNKVTIDVNALTGKSLTSLNDLGVVSLMYTLRRVAGDAQIAVNDATATTPEETLKSFPESTSSSPVNGIIEVQTSSVFNLPVGINAIGEN